LSKPPAEVSVDQYAIIADPLWHETAAVECVPARDLVSNLLWQALARTLVWRGLKRDPASGLFYFPRGLFRKNKIRYTGRRGRKTWVSVLGEKTLRGRPYRYFLAPDFQIRQDLGADFVAQLKIRIVLADAKGRPFDHAAMIVRRKHLASSWFNEHWLSRVLAIASYLAKGKSEIVLLERNDPVILIAAPISGEVDVSIDEASLRGLREEVAANTPGWEEEEEEQEGN
jgi:hypothetical protein